MRLKGTTLVGAEILEMERLRAKQEALFWYRDYVILIRFDNHF